MGRRAFTDEDDPEVEEPAEEPVAEADEQELAEARRFLSPGLADLSTFPVEHAAFHRQRDMHLAKAMRIEHRKLVALEGRVGFLGWVVLGETVCLVALLALVLLLGAR